MLLCHEFAVSLQRRALSALLPGGARHSTTKDSTMTEATLDVTDKFGNIRRDYSAAEIESLSPERRERFTTLLSAALDAQEAEAEMVEATRAVTDAVIDLQNAEREHAK